MQSILLLRRAGVLAVVIVVVLTAALYGCSSSHEQRKIAETRVSIKEAKETAFEDAGVTPEKTLVTRRKLTNVSGKPEYTICFVTQNGNNTVRYQYTIDGMEGTVIDRSKRIRTFAEARTVDDAERPDDRQGEGFIGVAKAKSIILKDAGLDKKETVFKVVRLESRRDLDVYVVEFESMGISYLFDIDAVDGTVITREVRFDD